MNKDICLCFFGLIRSGEETSSNVQKNIIEILQKNKLSYDVYLHTYDLKFINNPRSKEINCSLNIDDYKLFNPDFLSITDQSLFDKSYNLKEVNKNGDPWYDKCKSLKNLLRQLNSLMIVTDLWINKGNNYKCFIYLRSDLKYSKLDINAVKDIIKNPDKNNIYVPMWQVNPKFQCNDRFAIGTKSSILKWSRRYTQCFDYADKHKLHAETFLKYILDFHKINIKKLNMFGIRIRADGTIYFRDINLIKHV